MSVFSPDDLNAAYATLKAMRPDAVLMFSDALLVGWGPQITAFTLSRDCRYLANSACMRATGA